MFEFMEAENYSKAQDIKENGALKILPVIEILSCTVEITGKTYFIHWRI